MNREKTRPGIKQSLFHTGWRTQPNHQELCGDRLQWLDKMQRFGGSFSLCGTCNDSLSTISLLWVLELFLDVSCLNATFEMSQACLMSVVTLQREVSGISMDRPRDLALERGAFCELTTSAIVPENDYLSF